RAGPARMPSQTRHIRPREYRNQRLRIQTPSSANASTIRLCYRPGAMLDLRYVTDNLDEVRRRLATRAGDASLGLDRLAELDERRRTSIAEVEALRAERNEASKAMA